MLGQLLDDQAVSVIIIPEPKRFDLVIHGNNEERFTIEGAGASDPSCLRKDYASYVRAAPTLIHRTGLLQALAFMHAKGGAHQLLRLQLLVHLARVLDQPIAQIAIPGALDAESGDRANTQWRSLLTATDCFLLMRAVDESLAYTAWLKRFAEALIVRDTPADAEPQEGEQEGEEGAIDA